MCTGHIRIMKAAVINAIKDYALRREYYSSKSGKIVKDGPYKVEVRNWVENMAGTFKLCAACCNMTPDTLQKLMLDKMDKIDKGKGIYHYKKTKKTTQYRALK